MRKWVRVPERGDGPSRACRGRGGSHIGGLGRVIYCVQSYTSSTVAPTPLASRARLAVLAGATYHIGAPSVYSTWSCPRCSHSPSLVRSSSSGAGCTSSTTIDAVLLGEPENFRPENFSTENENKNENGVFSLKITNPGPLTAAVCVSCCLSDQHGCRGRGSFSRAPYEGRPVPPAADNDVQARREWLRTLRATRARA